MFVYSSDTKGPGTMQNDLFLPQGPATSQKLGTKLLTHKGLQGTLPTHTITDVIHHSNDTARGALTRGTQYHANCGPSNLFRSTRPSAVFGYANREWNSSSCCEPHPHVHLGAFF